MKEGVKKIVPQNGKKPTGNASLKEELIKSFALNTHFGNLMTGCKDPFIKALLDPKFLLWLFYFFTKLLTWRFAFTHLCAAFERDSTRI